MNTVDEIYTAPASSTVQDVPMEYNQCQEAVKRLTDYLSHELDTTEAETVQNHLSKCRGCFAKFQFEDTLLRTIREKVDQVRAPETLREKILNLITPKM